MSFFDKPLAGNSAEQPNLFDLLQGRTEPAEVSVPSQTDESLVLDEQPEIGGEIEGQAGRLPPEARRALVGLLRHGVIMADGKRLQFEALCRYRAPIEAHLADMYLRLLLDEQAGLAILLQQEADELDEDDEVSSLIVRRTLTLYDTLLLLVLRKHYQERQNAGEQRVIIDIDRIDVALRPFLPLTNSSRTDRRQLSGALKNMKDRKILAAVRGDEERFEITAVIRYVVNAAFLEQMLEEYLKLAGGACFSEEQEASDD
ncbi:MAG: hypothetical protein CVV06_13880 [Gammaproteobacteria bacterium HGW-Gammaproteobacteria-10]|nr:MAG: hypothetical protein CVV06_13880 [Gammaproteobacteria bacterium HGW-Gammaproteobacteria-10]